MMVYLIGIGGCLLIIMGCATIIIGFQLRKEVVRGIKVIALLVDIVGVSLAYFGYFMLGHYL